MGGAVLDGTCTHIDNQTVGMQKICPEDGVLHISYYENPGEGAPEVQADGKGPSTAGGNITTIGSSEGVLGWTATILAVSWQHTDRGTRVY